MSQLEPPPPLQHYAMSRLRTLPPACASRCLTLVVPLLLLLCSGATLLPRAAAAARPVRSLLTGATPRRWITQANRDPLMQQVYKRGPPEATRDTGRSTVGMFWRFTHANFFRSNAVFIGTFLTIATVASGLYDRAFQAAWEFNNRGKLYKDIIKHYPGLPPNTEPEGGAPAAAEAEAESEEPEAEASEAPAEEAEVAGEEAKE